MGRPEQDVQRGLKPDLMNAQEPTQAQLDLAEKVIASFSPCLSEYGFALAHSSLSRYFGEIVFLNGRQFVRFNWSDYPTDYPGLFRIELGWDVDKPWCCSLAELMVRAKVQIPDSSLATLNNDPTALNRLLEAFQDHAPSKLRMTLGEFKQWKDA